MKLEGKRVILTGATGGIGREIAAALAAKGAWVVLVGRGQQQLSALEKRLKGDGFGADRGIFSLAADVTSQQQRSHIVAFSHGAMGGVDLLINLAGEMSFSEFSVEPPEVTEQLFQTNVLAPMQLSRLVIPGMVSQGAGTIVNVGSIFGSIAFAWFTTYSSTKYALRGFSEALRRELVDTGVEVNYFAPRAVATPFNSRRMMEMCQATGSVMDSPQQVAQQLIHSLERDQKERYLGYPERLFVRINSLFPRLVDRALKGKNRVAKMYLEA